jgi:hypothetical protein
MDNEKPYWIGQTKKLGYILFDKKQQDGSKRNVNLFVCNRKEFLLFDSKEMQNKVKPIKNQKLIDCITRKYEKWLKIGSKSTDLSNCTTTNEKNRWVVTEEDRNSKQEYWIGQSNFLGFILFDKKQQKGDRGRVRLFVFEVDEVLLFQSDAMHSMVKTINNKITVDIVKTKYEEWLNTHNNQIVLNKDGELDLWENYKEHHSPVRDCWVGLYDQAEYVLFDLKQQHGSRETLRLFRDHYNEITNFPWELARNDVVILTDPVTTKDIIDRYKSWLKPQTESRSAMDEKSNQPNNKDKTIWCLTSYDYDRLHD